MAKSSSTVFTRLALTVAARYYPTEGIVDSYCLDGRFPGRREQRSVDSTLDREDRGFLFSIFGYPYNRQEDDTSWREPLERLTEKINDPSSDIDSGLNDLADAAMDVTGRITIAEAGAREPYFSGFVLRDGEVAAVTLGAGAAMLYRRGVLYPLTDETMDFNAVDADGQAVGGINDFIAGEAGTLRYSNIAQIEQGDVLLICNQELYQALGQRDIMRILNSAEDQYDAAGLLLTSASAQVPGTPLQLMLGMVESVMEDSRKSSQLNLGRFNTQVVMGTPFDAPVPADPDEQATQRYQRQDMVDFLSEPEAEAKPDDSWEKPDDTDAAFRPEYSEPDNETASFDQIKDDSTPAVPGFAYTSPEDQRRRFGQGEIYDDSADQDDAYSSSAYKGQVWDDSYLGDDDDDLYYDEDDERAKYVRSSRNKQIIFYVVLIAIIALCIFALIKLLGGGKDDPDSTESNTTTPVVSTETPPVIVPPVNTDPTDTQTDPTEDTTETTPAPADSTYVVQAGDSPWGIMMESYGTYSDELYAAFMEYNGKAVGDNIFTGEELLVPPQAVLDALIED
ncbi:MAG: LysM peptidoglycan-binding domain-containing protein [Clostridiaceae bacterium]|nr:LysM peptidoglycan-binding domain-containing protein [Clostridiaceae bacterium]